MKDLIGPVLTIIIFLGLVVGISLKIYNYISLTTHIDMKKKITIVNDIITNKHCEVNGYIYEKGNTLYSKSWIINYNTENELDSVREIMELKLEKIKEQLKN